MFEEVHVQVTRAARPVTAMAMSLFIYGYFSPCGARSAHAAGMRKARAQKAQRKNARRRQAEEVVVISAQLYGSA